MDAPRLLRLHAEKTDNGRIVIGDDNNHYRFCRRWPQPPQVVATPSALKGTIVIMCG